MLAFLTIDLLWIRYTSSSLNSLLIFTKSDRCSFSYKKFCFSSSSVGVVGDCCLDGAGDGPLIERVGRAARSFLGVIFVLFATLCDELDGSLWHSTISIFSRGGEFLVSSLSHIRFDGFSEKRRYREIQLQTLIYSLWFAETREGIMKLTFWLPDGMFSALFAFRQRTLCDP